MTELQEITNDKNFNQLLSVLKWQLGNGEDKGGAIVSHVLRECEKAADTDTQRQAIKDAMKD